MKSKIDEVTKTEHYKYNEFRQEQYIVNLDKGDRVKIEILDKEGNHLDEKLYIASYSNSHINCNWQDKGERKELEVKK